MQKEQNTTPGLVWFNTNLRVQDNVALHNAINSHEHIIAVYCFDPKHYESTAYGFKKTGAFRTQFLIETITALKANLKLLNIELFVFLEQPEDVLPKLLDTFNISSIYMQKEWTSEEIHTLSRVKKSVPDTTKFHQYYDQFLYHPEAINMPTDRIPKVFTVFRKHVEKQVIVSTQVKNEATKPYPKIVNTSTIPSLNDLGCEAFSKHPNSAFPFSGGESAALNRLHDYFYNTKKLGFYKKTRNGLIGADFSSKFSPWLANGSISARTIYWHVKAFESQHYKNQSTYWLVFELIWRDYFKYISLKHHNSIFKIGGILNRDYTWGSDENLIQDWINGNTKSNFVNANMLELKRTGWMSNRGRQNVASYFAKTLGLDWRIGASYFESLLIDYDVHSNYGNWMYVAGVGNDPRDRTFNVDLQAERYDPKGKFQNLWLQPSLF